MRLLKFFGAFLVTTLILFAFVFGLNWNAFTTFIENREGMAEGSEWVSKTGSLQGLSEFMGEKPENSSLASIVIVDQDSAIYYQQNIPRVMGTTANFFILLAYASKFDSGEINPDQTIQWPEVSRYQLPEVEESIHNEALHVADERGWIDNESISYMHALELLAQYGDLALADYLWWQLDPNIWAELQDTLTLSSTEMPLPYSGLYQAISPGLTEKPNSEIVNNWQGKSSDEWRNHVIDLSRTYLNDADFREQVQDYMDDDRLGNTFMEERDAMILFPKTTAGEMSGLLKKMVRDSLINENISRTMRDFMDWPMDNQPQIEQDFTEYGAIYDNRMGLMNGIDFGISAYTGDTTVQAFYLDQLPVGFWFHASGSQMHQDFMQRMIYDPAMIEQMHSVVEKQNN
ncbi:hypothetical protein [Rhodohalobacter sp. 614A]|uniref:hypothetical protein n=1 Tax=Rhodohalobacter sp. 614A TaxID=2908649 RepID=UPI001F1F4728|nr:hypothetical protein [Rhodohalobacter sp. 614A]